MKTDKHTEGPWEACDDGTAVRNSLTDNRIIALTDEDILMAPEERRANARLIAAAPEMLAALEEIHRLVILAQTDPGSGELFEIQEQARALIAKARGE